VLRAQFEKAIEGARIGEQPCVKLCPLTLPAVSTTLTSTQQVTIDPVFDPSHLNLVPVLE
jgi:hypothetical protein